MELYWQHTRRTVGLCSVGTESHSLCNWPGSVYGPYYNDNIWVTPTHITALILTAGESVRRAPRLTNWLDLSPVTHGHHTIEFALTRT